MHICQSRPNKGQEPAARSPGAQQSPPPSVRRSCRCLAHSVMLRNTRRNTTGIRTLMARKGIGRHQKEREHPTKCALPRSCVSCSCSWSRRRRGACSLHHRTRRRSPHIAERLSAAPRKARKACTPSSQAGAAPSLTKTWIVSLDRRSVARPWLGTRTPSRAVATRRAALSALPLVGAAALAMNKPAPVDATQPFFLPPWLQPQAKQQA